MAIFELIKNFKALLTSGESMEDLLCQVIFCFQFFDLLDQLLLCILDVNLVNTGEGLHPRRTSLAWLVAIALEDA